MRSLVIGIVLLLSGSALAQEQPPPSPLKTVAITISPIHLIFPVIELTGEYAVSPKMGAALVVGAGTITPENSSEKFTVFELGGSFRYYALGTFRSGLQVGAELLFVKVTGEVDSVSGVGQGLSVGPFVGYKWTHSSGFTIDLQGGVAFMAIKAETSAGGMDEDRDVGPLVNINIGWSF